jgi:hypothetical protein
MNAPRHHGLDQRTQVLVDDRALVLVVTAAVEAICHRLVLEIAFAALIANRAIEGMVDQQEFHNALAGLAYPRRIRANDHAIAGRHRTRGDGLG